MRVGVTAIDDRPSPVLPGYGATVARRRFLRVVIATIAVLAAVAVLLVRTLATSGQCTSSRCSRAGGVVTRDVAVTMQNYRVDVPHVLAAGRVRFVVANIGPTMHEFNVARTRSATTGLPLNADGTVDDHGTHPDFVHLGEVEGIDLGQHKTLTLTLTPGSYVVYCNMDGHFLAGMKEHITVIA